MMGAVDEAGEKNGMCIVWYTQHHASRATGRTPARRHTMRHEEQTALASHTRKAKTRTFIQFTMMPTCVCV